MMRFFILIADLVLHMNKIHNSETLKKKEKILIYSYFSALLFFIFLLQFVSTALAFLYLLLLLVLIPILIRLDKNPNPWVISRIKHLIVIFILIILSVLAFRFGPKAGFFSIMFPPLYLMLWTTGLLSNWQQPQLLYFILLAPLVYGILIYFDVNINVTAAYFVGCMIYPAIISILKKQKSKGLPHA